MDEDFKTKALESTLQSPSETLLSIQLLDFKTSLLEAIEELRIRREAEIHYEDQINKIVVEKQELEWQKEALQHQTDTLHHQNEEAVATFKKQLQTRVFAMEEEKGKYQLAVETKEKEIDGLKEALKALQISKYALQKKLNEMDQKLQMHLTAKGEHHKKLNEVEKCYATIVYQFGIVKGIHGKLEHSVQEAIQLNKKLTSVNKRQETEIIKLKEELKKVTTDLIRSKVTSQYRVGEENINLAAKEKEFQELQQKIRMETEVSKKVQEENTRIKEEKLEILSSLQCVQGLLQRITQTNVRMEGELNALKEEYQTLERDNELQREKAKENEEKFLNLQNEHEKALRTWKKDEENMRKEIDTIKNELNSFKGVYGHLEDYHSPQENQHSEQAENLQMHSTVQPILKNGCGQEQSKDSEIQATQKENECIEYIRKDSIFGHKEVVGIKNTMDYSLSMEEVQLEQILQVPENSCKNEYNVASPCEEKQREASSRKNTLCTDTDLITQGQAWEVCVTECKAAENLGTIPRMLLEEKKASLECKLRGSTEALAALHVETGKVFLDCIDTAGVYKKNASQETNSSKQELGNATEESACTNADKKTNTIQYNKSVLMTEAPSKESEVALSTEENAGPERSTDSHQAKELNFGILSYTKENHQAEYQECSLLDSDNYVDNRLHETEKKTLNLSDLHTDKCLCKQKHVDVEERNYNDNARNISRRDALLHVGFPAADGANPLAACRAHGHGDDLATEGGNDRPLGGTSSSSAKAERGGRVTDMQSNQPERAGTEQMGRDTNTCALNAENVSTVNADDLEIIIHKETSKDRSSADDKLIPCEKVNNDTQIQSIKNEHSLQINDNSINNALLKEKKDSLNSTVPGSKFAEGHLKESCSLPMRTSGNLVNISGRSSFDLSTSDKKAEKTPVYLNFLDLSSCSRVNQVRSQTMWTSASKEPSLLKEKLPGLAENRKMISKTQYENLSESVVRKEMGLGSTSFNRAANTLNICSIHQDPQGEPSEEWNAIAKTFYDSSFPTEHVKEGFDVLKHEQKSSHMTVTPVISESALRDEDRCSTQNFNIKSQIEEIEKFLNLERLHSSRKRKYEES
ncbi:coiled-coil domain-containing protein 73 [Apteryx rowi]|uniref:coiled-coil domain-containing protein 73 n=1 Tax=Apteryx rowi TaxID=308060 RepID=UPI000E1D9236|nr:coiled-coil domain-containing protein 73 [Apteryx rowi]